MQVVEDGDGYRHLVRIEDQLDPPTHWTELPAPPDLLDDEIEMLEAWVRNNQCLVEAEARWKKS